MIINIYFMFLENFEIFLNGILNFPNKWRVKESFILKFVNLL